MKKNPLPVIDTTPKAPLLDTAPDIDALRAASTLDDAVKLLQPAPTTARADTVYEVVNPCPALLPQKRGVSVSVYVAAARYPGSFRVSDLQTALPDKNPKNVAYWTRRLATLGFLKPQAS